MLTFAPPVFGWMQTRNETLFYNVSSRPLGAGRSALRDAGSKQWDGLYPAARAAIFAVVRVAALADSLCACLLALCRRSVSLGHCDRTRTELIVVVFASGVDQALCGHVSGRIHTNR